MNFSPSAPQNREMAGLSPAQMSLRDYTAWTPVISSSTPTLCF